MQVVLRRFSVSQLVQPPPQNNYTSSSSAFQELKKNNLMNFLKRIDAEEAYLLQ